LNLPPRPESAIIESVFLFAYNDESKESRPKRRGVCGGPSWDLIWIRELSGAQERQGDSSHLAAGTIEVLVSIRPEDKQGGPDRERKKEDEDELPCR
jgi:hypothetical protein